MAGCASRSPVPRPDRHRVEGGAHRTGARSRSPSSAAMPRPARSRGIRQPARWTGPPSSESTRSSTWPAPRSPATAGRSSYKRELRDARVAATTLDLRDDRRHRRRAASPGVGVRRELLRRERHRDVRRVLTGWRRVPGPAMRGLGGEHGGGHATPASALPSSARAWCCRPRAGRWRRCCPLFRFGLGGRFGSGRQWQSWIAIDDHVAAVIHVLEGAAVGTAEPDRAEPGDQPRVHRHARAGAQASRRDPGPDGSGRRSCSVASWSAPCSIEGSGCCRPRSKRTGSRSASRPSNRRCGRSSADPERE